MRIRIQMTRAEVQSAWNACSAMDDNEHDKGADSGWCLWQGDIIDDAISTLHAAHESGAESMVVDMHPATFGLMCDAVEIYCTDSEDEDTADADHALAARLLSLSDVEIVVVGR